MAALANTGEPFTTLDVVQMSAKLDGQCAAHDVADDVVAAIASGDVVACGECEQTGRQLLRGA